MNQFNIEVRRRTELLIEAERDDKAKELLDELVEDVGLNEAIDTLSNNYADFQELELNVYEFLKETNGYKLLLSRFKNRFEETISQAIAEDNNE